MPFLQQLSPIYAYAEPIKHNSDSIVNQDIKWLSKWRSISFRDNIIWSTKYKGCWESEVPYFFVFFENNGKNMEKIYLKGNTVTTFQNDFHWRLSICHTMLWVYLYRTHKTFGPISERSCDINFPFLHWTETSSYPVCFSILKKRWKLNRAGSGEYGGCSKT